MNELKPCPFCGQKAVIFRRMDTMQQQDGHTFRKTSDHSYYIVTCGNSECKVCPESCNVKLEKAIEFWNGREE